MAWSVREVGIVASEYFALSGKFDVQVSCAEYVSCKICAI